METESTIYKVYECFKCPGDTEYYCVTCKCDMCPLCKETHVQNLKTTDHYVVLYSEKLDYIEKENKRHPSKIFRKYCETCQVTFSYHSRRHRGHITLDVRGAYNKKRHQQYGANHTMRSEVLFHRTVLLSQIKADIKTCHRKLSHVQSEMFTKAQKLKDLIDKVEKNLTDEVFCDKKLDLKYICLKQDIKMSEHIVSLQKFEHRYEQSAFTFSALQFLSSIKTTLSKIYLTLHTSQLSMTDSLNKENLMESLGVIKFTERGNRIGNQCLLELMSGAQVHQSLTPTGVDCCHHISRMTSDKVWVDDGSDLILTNTTGASLHRVENLCIDHDCGGLHTVNSESELIYIDRYNNINKLLKNLKTTTTFIKRTDDIWNPTCVNWSPSTGDLLVAMCNYESKIGKVNRYEQGGELTQTIQHLNTVWPLYSKPKFITENNNGDIVVSDWHQLNGLLVVTDRDGIFRFCYKGHPSGSGFWPLGICTDALSHILMCDLTTCTVQMIDRDGQFLSHLLIRPSGTFYPTSLSYDVNTHRIWVGTECNTTMVVYRYITKQTARTATGDVIESLGEDQTTATEKPTPGNQCLLKLLSPPKLLRFFKVTGGHHCYHISSVTLDQIWVNNGHEVFLTNTTGAILHRVKNSLGDLYTGGHTVNSDSKLIYIDKNCNIKKLSKDMKKTTKFIKITDSIWKPLCLYSSLSTGDLLVGMLAYVPIEEEKAGDTNDNDDTNVTEFPTICKGKVTRYDQSGQQTQTIQHDNTGLDLYIYPTYITENNNGDIVVSDNNSAVVVTDHGGRHRFSYTGNPPGSGLRPLGICTDALSHILVCDDITVHILNSNGQFLSHLLIRPSKNFSPISLSYDVNTHRLWIGSLHRKVCVYRYISRQDARTDEKSPCPDSDVLSS